MTFALQGQYRSDVMVVFDVRGLAVAHLGGDVGELQRRRVDVPGVAGVHARVAADDQAVGDGGRLLAGEQQARDIDVGGVGEFDPILLVDDLERDDDPGRN